MRDSDAVRPGPDPYLPTHGDDRYTVEHYDLTLDYKVATNRLSARAVLNVRALVDTESLRVDLYGLHVDAVSVARSKPRKWTQKGRHVVIRLAEPLAAGRRVQVAFAYSGKPSGVPGPFGTAGWEELRDGVLVASQPYGSPSWFPCNDRASDRATHHLLVTVDPGYEAIGNGRLVATTSRHGRTTWTYEERHAIPPYLMALHIGRYRPELTPGDDPRIELFGPADRTLLAGTPLRRLSAMLAALERWAGPYPFEHFRAVVADDELEIPLEAAELASFGVNHLEPTWENERLVVHELAHQWFGNALTAETWRHIWLHEGFACYAEWLWSQERGLESCDARAAAHWAALAAADQPAPLADPGVTHMFDDWVYKRGALTLHALRAELGDAGFFDVLAAWVATYRGSSVETADFVSLAAERSGRELGPLFAAWLDAVALPPCPVVGA